MENTIILNSGQKIEVLFQDEVSLDIDCALRYIESGEKELDNYVKNNVKPSLDQVVVQAQTDMETQIAQGIIDAAQAASISATDAINTSIVQAKAEVEAYVSVNIMPDLNSAVSSASQSAQDAATSEDAAFESAQTANTYATNAQASANAAQASATSAAQSAQDAEDAAQEAITKSSYGNIGDIKYTTRTDVPNGGAWCDGTEYSKAAFPDLYQMLVDDKLQKTDYTTFAESVSTNGSCGFFALDEDNEKFKVPLLKDVYLKAGDTPSIFGAESLPNITGSLGETGNKVAIGNASGTDLGTSGAFTASDRKSFMGFATGGGGYSSGTVVKINASLSSSTYQDGAKVNPDHVVYKAYVVLYSSAAEASEAQAVEFINALGSKANVDLSNVNPAQSFKDMSVAWGMPDYTTLITGSSKNFIQVQYDSFVCITASDSYSENYCCYVSPDNGNTKYVVGYRMDDVNGNTQTTSFTFLVPKDWYFQCTSEGTPTYYIYKLKGTDNA